MEHAAVGVRYRVMERRDIDAGLRLCRASRWNQVARDWEMFLDFAPGGARVAERNGNVIGTVATIPYEDRFTWVSMVLVDPAERGQGVGTTLLRHALDILRDTATVKLDATPAGHPIYRTLGFEDEYGLVRMESADPVAGGIEAGGARPFVGADMEAIAAMDREVFGAGRRKLLDWLAAGAPEYAWVTETGGVVSGYSFGRHGHNFEHVGPIVAADLETARALLVACLAGAIGRRVILDAPEHSPEWLGLLASLGFREQRPFIRMYLGENRHAGLPRRQYAIAGPELG